MHLNNKLKKLLLDKPDIFIMTYPSSATIHHEGNNQYHDTQKANLIGYNNIGKKWNKTSFVMITTRGWC